MATNDSTRSGQDGDHCIAVHRLTPKRPTHRTLPPSPRLCAVNGCGAPETRDGLCEDHNAEYVAPMLMVFSDKLIALIEHTDQDDTIMPHAEAVWLAGEDKAHCDVPLCRPERYALQLGVILAVPNVLERAVRTLEHDLWALVKGGAA